MSSSRFRIADLADHLDLGETIARWHWNEWGSAEAGESLAAWTAGLCQRTNRDAIPTTFVALDGEELLGSVSLVEHDLPTRVELSPWVAGVYVQASGTWSRRGERPRATRGAGRGGYGRRPVVSLHRARPRPVRKARLARRRRGGVPGRGDHHHGARRDWGWPVTNAVDRSAGDRGRPMLAEARKTAGEIVRPSLAIDRVPVTKMCGSGNDFIVLDNRNGIIEEDDAAAFARRVCRRRMAVGADGLVLIERPTTSSAQFRWRYLNADGSEVEMCGNGAMCGARFAYLNGIAPASCVFETPSGLVHASVNPDRARNDVRIAIADSGALQRDLLLDIAGQTYRLHAVAVGVPHAVLMRDPGVPDWPHGDFVAWGRSVRHHPRFAPAGTNVDAITIDADGLVRMRTYERGVEDETLACGTGAVASAIVAGAFGLTAPPVTVMTASDLPLTVDFTWDGKSARDVSLAGTARVVMSGEIWPEALV